MGLRVGLWVGGAKSFHLDFAGEDARGRAADQDGRERRHAATRVPTHRGGPEGNTEVLPYSFSIVESFNSNQRQKYFFSFSASNFRWLARCFSKHIQVLIVLILLTSQKMAEFKEQAAAEPKEVETHIHTCTHIYMYTRVLKHTHTRTKEKGNIQSDQKCGVSLEDHGR